jgi:enoyl-CoA hydratase/carnithine racemase
MSAERFLASKKDAAGSLIFNHPEKHNAISSEMSQA